MKYKDYYETLGVPRTATTDDIKRAYRKLARKYHPDVSKASDAEARFKEINEANEVLKDTEKRAAYDQMGSHWKAGQEFSPPPNRPGGFEFRSSGGMPGEGLDASDFFESLFGRGIRPGARRGPRADVKGEDHHARVTIDLEDSYRGGSRSVALRVPSEGSDGRVTVRERTLDVNIPAGIRPGQQLRLAGQGGPGRGSAPAGDLYLEVEIAPHPRFRLDGADVSVDLPLAPWEAALGAAVEVQTPEGTVQLTVPAGSTTGRRLRLKGRGLPGKSPGDLYVVLTIALPKAASEAERHAYEAMAQAFPRFDARLAPTG